MLNFTLNQLLFIKHLQSNNKLALLLSSKENVPKLAFSQSFS